MVVGEFATEHKALAAVVCGLEEEGAKTMSVFEPPKPTPR
jgi:hypothetical protein